MCIYISTSSLRWVLKWGTIGWLPSSMTSSCTLPYWSSFILWVMLSVLQYSPKEGTYTNTPHFSTSTRVAQTTLYCSSIIANLVLFILWGNALIAQAFLFSAVFNNTRVATSKFSPFLFGWKKKNNIIFSLFSLFILFGYLTSHPFLRGQCYRYVTISLCSTLYILFTSFSFISLPGKWATLLLDDLAAVCFL